MIYTVVVAGSSTPKGATEKSKPSEGEKKGRKPKK